MTDADLFFTHTVVGQALSVELGRPLDSKTMQTQGLEANLASSNFSLSSGWKEWCLIQGAYPYAGLPRRRPGRFRRDLERHALVLAVVGLLMSVTSAGLWAALVWFPDLLTLPLQLHT